jgi:hypothetical protein
VKLVVDSVLSQVIYIYIIVSVDDTFVFSGQVICALYYLPITSERTHGSLALAIKLNSAPLCAAMP